MIWHSADINEVYVELESNADVGLGEETAKSLAEKDGLNFVGAVEPGRLLTNIIKHIKAPVSITLAVSAVLMMLVNVVYKADKPFAVPLIIIALFALTVVFSAVRDYVCAAVMSRLKIKNAPKAKVLRESQLKTVCASQLVVGDIIFLSKGDLIPADARLIESDKLSCDESALTGHSVPVAKDAHAQMEDITPLAERSNMVFAGCFVTYGSAKAIVTQTGINCEVRKLDSAYEDSEMSVATKGLRNLSSSIRKFSPFLFVFIILLDFIFIRFGAGGDELHLLEIGAQAFMFSAALIAAVTPEWLSSIATVIMTVGTCRMIKDGVVITNPGAIDKIGKVSVICTDKAALTERNMKVAKLFNGFEMVDAQTQIDKDCLYLIKMAAICCNDGSDPAEAAIIDTCLRFTGISKDELENLYPRLNEISFDSETGLMATVNMIDGESFAIVKGAPEAVIKHCNDERAQSYLEAAQALGSEALHVLAVAIKPLNDIGTAAIPTSDDIFGELKFLGLVGMTNSLLSDTVDAVRLCRATGSKPVMITGDSKATAIAVARQAGILTDDAQALSSEELAEFDELELVEKISQFTVFARVNPDDKVRIVSALQATGETVVITGRRSQDCAALRAADVGFSLGITGTDTARDASDAVLTEDKFSSIVAAVNRSSTMYECIRKALHFALCYDFSIVLTILFGLFIWQTPVLNHVQMLFIALIVNIVPPFAFAMEPIHKRKASARKLHIDSFFEGNRRVNLMWHGAVIAIVSLIAYAIGSSLSAAVAGAAAYCVFLISIALYSFSLRSRSNVFKLGLLNNPFMLAAIAISVIVTMLSLGFSSIGLGADCSGFAFWIILLSVVPLIAAEAGKYIIKR